MRNLILILLILENALVLCARTSIKDNIFQIQGVFVDDAYDNAINDRRKREAVQPVQPVLDSSSTALDNQRSARHISYGYPLQPPQLLQHALLQQQHQQQAFLQQQQQKGQQQQQHLLNLPANGFAPKALQQPGLQSQLPSKPVAPTGKEGSAYRTSPKKKKSTEYAYPPRMPLPLSRCFHNPTGYVCCNVDLNDLMVDTYSELEQRPKFQPCNLNVIASQVQLAAQRHFNTSFETIVGIDDFAQKINFRGDMVCKVEVGNRFIIAYATATEAYNHDLSGKRRERETEEEFSWASGIAESWHSIHSSLF